MIDTIIKRDGNSENFNPEKIHHALMSAFVAVEGDVSESQRIRDIVSTAVNTIVKVLNNRAEQGETIRIETIQDQVELELMRAGEQKVARAYVLYREEHAKARGVDSTSQPNSGLNVTQPDGTTQPLNVDHLRGLIEDACAGLPSADPEPVYDDTVKNLYDGVTADGVSSAMVMASKALIEKEPDYIYVTSRLLQDKIRREALGYLLDTTGDITHADMKDYYPAAFAAFIMRGVELGRLDPALEKFDIKRLGEALDHERDTQFTYLSLQTLYDRYFLHHDEVRYELPQVMFMRVAMGLALQEDHPNERAIEFYRLLSSFDYMSSTPTLFNSGTTRSQLSSCYLTTVPDNLDGIYEAVHDNAMLSKWAGGLGNDWTQVRAMGARIEGTNGKSQGVVPFLKVVNDTAVAVNQGGKRKGAVCGYLESWHKDIEEFLELRKNTGDDRRRTHDMNTANWIPDLFMERVFDDGEWTLFSPSDCPDLHDLYGDEFREAYEGYEAQARAGDIPNHKVVQAKDLWRKMLSMLFETGHPWLTFKDPCNIRSPQQHVGVVHSSNLCTEITLNTSEDEIAVCNLGSVNLAQHITADGEIDHDKLRKTIRLAIRMLDNVIDINYYAVEKARRANMRHRPIGLGLMGFQDALYKMDISYASKEAVDFADTSMEAISYHAIEASCDLAVSRGAYASFEGSLWSKGVMPLDSQLKLAKSRRADHFGGDFDSTLDWDTLRDKVMTRGMRNSNTMAIAPTATISNICGVTQSIEPTYQNLFVKSNMSGEFTVVNEAMVRDLKAVDLWDEVMVNDLKYYDGSLQQINRVPDWLKAKYATAFEVEPKWLVEAAARRQKWLDQAQSLNLYIQGASGKKLDVTYRMAWYLGLKTTYYLRALGASGVEKSTVSRSKHNAVTSAPSTSAPAEPKGIEGYLTGNGGTITARKPTPDELDELACEACQ